MTPTQTRTTAPETASKTALPPCSAPFRTLNRGYNFPVDPKVAFTQTSGTVYWLDVKYVLSTNEPPQKFGWKTAMPNLRWNDDATWVLGTEPLPPSPPWGELTYPPVHPLSEQSLDLAFVIDGGAPAALDFGDAIDPSYPTYLANDGARHVIVAGFCLGQAVEADSDGQPAVPADGDDVIDGTDDEDGISATSLFAPGNRAYVDLVASQSGLLSAWIDYNADGDWADTNEQVCADASVTGGVNRLEFRIPRDVVSTNTFARLRISSAGGLSYTGLAADGEVEDHIVTIQPPITITNLVTSGATSVVVRTTGYYGTGTQVLQAASSLLPTNWVDVATNSSPLPPPQANVWIIAPRNATNEYYRIVQR